MYAKATDTGIDPKEAAKRLNLDWDSAAEIEESDAKDETEVPPAVVCFFSLLLKNSSILIGIRLLTQLLVPNILGLFLHSWLM